MREEKLSKKGVVVIGSTWKPGGRLTGSLTAKGRDKNKDSSKTKWSTYVEFNFIIFRVYLITQIKEIE